MATSGTVSLTVFKTRKIIDLAFRRCRLVPEQVVSQHLDTALDFLFLFLSALPNKGLALWAVQKHILPLYQDTLTVPCPLGTVDILNANLRTLQRVTGLNTSSEGNAALAFDGDLTTTCIETTPAGYIRTQFNGPTPMSSFGIMPGATATWDISIQTSQDGVTFTTIYSNPAFAAVTGQWQWIDVEGILDAPYVQLKANGTTILNVIEFVIGNTPSEIPLAKINRDDWVNLPNKSLPGRPVQFWFDKQVPVPNIQVWRVPDIQFTFAQIIMWTQRYVQDVGKMTDQLEIPQSWLLAVVVNLAALLAGTIKEVDPALIPGIQAEALALKNDAWGGQSDGSPMFLRPNIRRYTR
jgi:hypothetical protein